VNYDSSAPPKNSCHRSPSSVMTTTLRRGACARTLPMAAEIDETTSRRAAIRRSVISGDYTGDMLWLPPPPAIIYVMPAQTTTQTVAPPQAPPRTAVQGSAVVCDETGVIRCYVNENVTAKTRVDNMRYVAVTEGDKTEAELRFGVQVNTRSVNELADAVDDASPAAIDELVTEYLDLYDVAPELLPGSDRHQSLRDGAAIELGLRSFLEAGGFGAFTTSTPRSVAASTSPLTISPM